MQPSPQAYIQLPYIALEIFCPLQVIHAIGVYEAGYKHNVEGNNTFESVFKTHHIQGNTSQHIQSTRSHLQSHQRP